AAPEGTIRTQLHLLRSNREKGAPAGNTACRTRGGRSRTAPQTLAPDQDDGPDQDKRDHDCEVGQSVYPVDQIEGRETGVRTSPGRCRGPGDVAHHPTQPPHLVPRT